MIAAIAYPPGQGPWAFNAPVQALVVAEMLGLGAAYWAALRLLGPRYVEPGEATATRRQVTCFVLALVFLMIGEGWPLAQIANNYLFSAHMVQHIIFMMAVPPLLLLGTPSWLARILVHRPGVFPLMKRITKPIPATAIFNGILLVSHWPAFLNLTVHNQGIHIADHLLLLFGGLIMWWPVLSPLPELPRLSYPAQMLFLFVQSIIPTIPASFLTFASKPLYSYYATVPRAFGISALNDTQLSGIIMKLGMGVVLWTVIAVIFFRWSAREERPGRPADELEWQEVERALNRGAE
ncbi:MAG TPA: cytochrome c oxidase assembly protein [Actinomycetota bacterium]|nr:cytochrome c oxidase assembly protein [Actinomycetota bacterium]